MIPNSNNCYLDETANPCDEEIHVSEDTEISKLKLSSCTDEPRNIYVGLDTDTCTQSMHDTGKPIPQIPVQRTCVIKVYQYHRGQRTCIIQASPDHR